MNPMNPANLSVAKTPGQKTTPVTTTRTQTLSTTQTSKRKEFPKSNTPTSGTFRLQAKRLFLTYPKCETPKEEVALNIKAYFQENLQWFIVARELHEDGTPHIHAAIEVKVPIHTRKAEALDILVATSKNPKGQHGNYQSMKDQYGTIKYVTEDGDFLEEGIDSEAILAKKQGKHANMVALLKKGKTPAEVMEEYPCQYFLMRKQVHEFYNDLQLKQMDQKKPPLKRISAPPGKMQTDQAQLLLTWLQDNLMPQARKDRKPRSLHLYLKGPPGIGKSRMANELRNVLRVYDIPGEKWADSYENGIYDLLLFDEFNGQKTIQEMNVLTDGYVTPLVRRCKPPILKKDILPTIVISNKLPGEVYHKSDQAYVEAFASRYLIIDYGEEKIDLEFEIEDREPEKEKEKEKEKEEPILLDTDSEGEEMPPSKLQKLIEEMEKN